MYRRVRRRIFVVVTLKKTEVFLLKVLTPLKDVLQTHVEGQKAESKLQIPLLILLAETQKGDWLKIRFHRLLWDPLRLNVVRSSLLLATVSIRGSMKENR